MIYFHLKWVTTITFYCIYISFLITIRNVFFAPSLSLPLSLPSLSSLTSSRHSFNTKYFQVFHYYYDYDSFGTTQRRSLSLSPSLLWLVFMLYVDCRLPLPSDRRTLVRFTRFYAFRILKKKMFYAFSSVVIRLQLPLRSYFYFLIHFVLLLLLWFFLFIYLLLFSSFPFSCSCSVSPRSAPSLSLSLSLP